MPLQTKILSSCTTTDVRIAITKSLTKHMHSTRRGKRVDGALAHNFVAANIHCAVLPVSPFRAACRELEGRTGSAHPLVFKDVISTARAYFKSTVPDDTLLPLPPFPLRFIAAWRRKAASRAMIDLALADIVEI